MYFYYINKYKVEIILSDFVIFGKTKATIFARHSLFTKTRRKKIIKDILSSSSYLRGSWLTHISCDTSADQYRQNSLITACADTWHVRGTRWHTMTDAPVSRVISSDIMSTCDQHFSYGSKKVWTEAGRKLFFFFKASVFDYFHLFDYFDQRAGIFKFWLCGPLSEDHNQPTHTHTHTMQIHRRTCINPNCSFKHWYLSFQLVSIFHSSLKSMTKLQVEQIHGFFHMKV